MARTIETIKQEITDAFLANEHVRQLYDLSETDTFDATFSKASIESLLFHAVAVCAQTVERLVEEHRKYVEEAVSENVPATIPWYHAKSLAYRDGYALTFDNERLVFDYTPEAKADSKAAVVRYAAVRDEDYSVKLLVAADGGGAPTPLDAPCLERFKEYIDRIKPAGIVVNISSPRADEVQVSAKVALDPLQYNPDGSLVSDATRRPVEEAIRNYFRNITYGGTMSHMHLEDAIQSVEGVENVDIIQVNVRPAGTTAWTAAPSRYTATGGCFTPITFELIEYEM